METWLKCHVHAFEYFQGIAQLAVPDNLKTGVTKAHRYEPLPFHAEDDLSVGRACNLSLPAEVDRLAGVV